MDIAISSDSNEKKIYQDSTHELVSKIAYLIGVPKRIFENIHEPPEQEVFAQMDNEKSTRIIRHLSIIRTSIQRNYRTINRKMKTEYLSILSMPEYVPAESMRYLESEGIYFVKNQVRSCFSTLSSLTALFQIESITASPSSRYGLTGNISRICLLCQMALAKQVRKRRNALLSAQTRLSLPDVYELESVK